MGGGTVLDGVRRWFQRRTCSTSTSTSIIVVNANDDLRVSSLPDFQANTTTNNNNSSAQQEEQPPFFHLSSLHPIKVPKRILNSSMDPHKKVLLLLLLLYISHIIFILELCRFLMF